AALEAPARDLDHAAGEVTGARPGGAAAPDAGCHRVPGAADGVSRCLRALAFPALRPCPIPRPPFRCPRPTECPATATARRALGPAGTALLGRSALLPAACPRPPFWIHRPVSDRGPVPVSGPGPVDESKADGEVPRVGPRGAAAVGHRIGRLSTGVDVRLAVAAGTRSRTAPPGRRGERGPDRRRSAVTGQGRGRQGGDPATGEVEAPLRVPGPLPSAVEKGLDQEFVVAVAVHVGHERQAPGGVVVERAEEARVGLALLRERDGSGA